MKKLTFFGIFGLFILPSPGVMAEAKDKLFETVIAAYGGEAFQAMETMHIRDTYKRFLHGQSHSPSEVDMSDYDASIVIDFKNKRKSLRWFRGTKDNFSLQHRLYDGKRGYALDHSAQTVSENTNLTFDAADRRLSYFLDTVLAKMLVANKAQATYEGTENYKGLPHAKISFQAENSPELNVLIDPKTGYIRKMMRPHWQPGAYFSYHYKHHKAEDGVLYAEKTYVTRAGSPFELVTARQVEWGVETAGLFAVPAEYKEAPASLDFADMSVQKLDENLYLAGRNWGFSLFFDAGDYFIATGGYEGLTDRLEAVKTFLNVDKPLKYQIVTHHHLDHLGGMKEVAALGATFVAAENHQAKIRSVAGVPIPDERFMLLKGSASLAGGRVQVVDYPNSHANHNLVSYFAEAQTVFTADLFFSRQKSGAPVGYDGLKVFRDALREHGIDASYFAAAHSGRVLTAADLTAAIGNIPEDVCPSDWPQCGK